MDQTLRPSKICTTLIFFGLPTTDLVGFIPMWELLKAQWLGIVLLIGMMYDSGSFIVDNWKWVLIVAPTLRMNEKKHKTWTMGFKLSISLCIRSKTEYMIQRYDTGKYWSKLGVVNGEGYPLVNWQFAIEIQHFEYVNQRTKWGMFNSKLQQITRGF